jgi:hypothetical protein
MENLAIIGVLNANHIKISIIGNIIIARIVLIDCEGPVT